MNAIRRLWQAVAGLADALDRLTGIANAAADSIEQRQQPDVIEHQPAERLPRSRK